MKQSVKRFVKFFTDFKENKEIAKWLYDIGKNYKRYILGFVVINLLTMLLSLASSIAGKYVVDAATNFSSKLFYKYIVIMLATTVVSIVISFVTGMFTSYVNEKFAFGIRAKMYDDIQRSEWYSLRKYHSSDMLARLSSDVDTIASVLINLLPGVIVTSVQLVLVLVILFDNDPVLACIGLVVGPVGMLVGLAFKDKYSKYQKVLKESRSEYYTFLQESLSNISVVKTFQLEDANNETFADIRNRRMKLVLKSSALSSAMGSSMRFIYSLGYVIIFSWCAYRLTTSADVDGAAVFTYGTMTLFLSLVSQVQASIKSLGNIVPRLYILKISSKRIREISEIQNEDYTRKGTTPREVSLSAKNVEFAYETDEGIVLSDLSFEIPAKSYVGIVGSSGAGKTTFIRLLLALIKPDSGELEYVDENGNREVACVDSRRLISYVPQGNTLMTGTVRSNLLLGNKSATEEQMWEALRCADADKFLQKTPKGLDTVIAESSGGLSEGQAQRVSIARALLRNKPILIMDEATSALDESSEKRIFERLSQKREKTCFIITHRNSVLKYCDYVLQIDDDAKATLKKSNN